MTRNLLSKTALLPTMAVLCTAASLPAAAAPLYSILDLGTFGGPTSLGNGVNSSGQTTGQADLPGGNYNAFLTAPNSAITTPAGDLGTLPGFTVSVGEALNNTGQVTGYASDPGSPAVTDHAFVSSGGSLSDLGTFGGPNSIGLGINNAGTVVGGADHTGGATSTAFVHNGTGPLNAATDDLGTFGGDDSTATAINNAATAQVTGEAQVAGTNDYHAFRHTGSGTLNATTDDLGTLAAGNAGNSFGNGINLQGEVVGFSDTGATDAGGNAIQHAFLDNGVTLTDLGTLTGDESSSANGINDLGVIVGESDSAPGSTFDPNSFAGRTAVVDLGGGFQNLNTLIAPGLTYTLFGAFGVNNRGQIIASGVNANGQTQAFLLTPNTPAVPEPSSLSLLGLGLAGLGFVAARRRRA